jgi:hypothetical protein
MNSKHRTPAYLVTTDYAGEWMVIGRDFTKSCATFNEAHDLAKSMNDAHSNVVRLADALVAQHMRVVK